MDSTKVAKQRLESSSRYMDLAIEKDHRAERLILSRSCNLFLDCQMIEKLLDLDLAHL